MRSVLSAPPSSATASAPSTKNLAAPELPAERVRTQSRVEQVSEREEASTEMKESSSSSPDEKMTRIIEQQRKEIERSQKRIRELQRVHFEERRGKNELVNLLRTCLNDVKREIADRSILPPSDIDSLELKKSDRDQVLKTLLSKRHVIELLYSKTFDDTSLS